MKKWLIPDCFYPLNGPRGAYVSHESICVLNTSDHDACIDIALYFEDREPMTGFSSTCPARRTHHIRMDKLNVPRGIPYAAVVTSDVDITVQYSRLDTTQANCAMITAMGVAAG